MIHQPHKLCLLFICLLVSACAQNPQPLGKPLPDLHYDYLTAYEVNNGVVNIKQSAVIDAASFVTMKNMVMPFDRLLNRYARSRFINTEKAPTRPVTAIFDIKKLSFHKKADADNIVGILSGAAAELYTLDVYIKLATFNRQGHLNKPYTISIKRELHIPEFSSLAESEMMQFEFMENVIQDIDQMIIKFMSDINATLATPEGGNE